MRSALRQKFGPLAVGVTLIAALLVGGVTVAMANTGSTADRPAGAPASGTMVDTTGTSTSGDTGSTASPGGSESATEAAAAQGATKRGAATEAAAWKRKTVKGNSCPGLAGCANWKVSISARVKYNGRNVYVEVPPTCLADSRVVEIPKTVGTWWCGYVVTAKDKKGKPTKVSIGVNYHVDWPGPGSDYGFWARIDVDKRGKVTYRGYWKCDLAGCYTPTGKKIPGLK